jgi:outer membrane cobalamin receptor
LKNRIQQYKLAILSVFLIISALTFSQDLNKKISLRLQKQPLGEVIKMVGTLGNVYFSFNPEEIPVNKIISIRAKNSTVREICDKLFIPNGIDYFLLENQIILKLHQGVPDGDKTNLSQGQKNFTINGYLKNKSSGEVLIGANIYPTGAKYGTTTNAYGYYSLTIPEGQYEINYSFIGYKPVVKKLELKGNQKISVELEETKLEIPAVEVIDGNTTTAMVNSSLSQFRFSSRMLTQMPGFVGDFDIIKALQTVPGIKSFGDGSSLFYVRGGNSDQNLILLDEAPIYNPSHFFGFFSVLSPDAINDVETYKGDFPANYGSRLSSVIDIHAKNGNLKRFGFSGNIGPYASNLSVEGPIVRDKGSFYVSGRVSSLNWLQFLNETQTDFKVNFYDINAKLNYKLNENNRVFFTFYYGKDIFTRQIESSIHTYGISWNNLAGTFRWNHTFNPKLFINTTAYYSSYHYYLYVSKEQNNYWNSSIGNLAGKSDLTWYLNLRNTIKAGIEIGWHHSNPGNVNFSGNDEQKNIPKVSECSSLEYDFYISNEQTIGKKLSIRYGIRLPVWQDIGPATVYNFNDNHQVMDSMSVKKNVGYSTFFSPEPRIHIQYLLDDRSALRASYCRTTQFMQMLSNSTSPFTSLEVWIPSGPNIQPQKADQYVLGYTRQMFRSKLNFSTELFYKQFYNYIDYNDHANMLYNPLIEGELRFGKSWSYGIELTLRKSEGNFTGWIAYTFSRVFVHTQSVNNDHTYPAFYDRPHDLSVTLSYNTHKKWAVCANWMLVSGGPITTPVGYYYINGYSVPIYGDKNNDRLPVYHRLDISISYTFNKPENRFRHSLILTLYNAYGRNNPFSINFNRVESNDGTLVVPSNINGGYELVPTNISVAGIIPSINYQFNF